MTSSLNIPAYLMPGVPVVQPSHLEGDASLATEILPGPPSLQAVRQVGLSHKRDPKKPSLSYLPVSDPGTTYGGHMVAPLGALPVELDGPRRKRARVDKGSASNRAQRASARNVNGAPSFGSEITAATSAAPSSPTQVPDSDSFSASMDLDKPYISRSNSLLNVEESIASSSTATKGSKKDNGKGKEKEKDKFVARVKEEPVAVTLPLTEYTLPNEDHCSSCRSIGGLVYCDGCPRAFHLWCLDPPVEPGVLSEGDKWFCPSCSVRQNPPSKLYSSIFSPLTHQLEISIPVEFQLPEDIRGFFKDVASNARGGYVDSSEIKPPRLNRHGQLEDRDPYRLKDRNGAAVLCFRCGTSALPDDATAVAPAAKRVRRSSAKSCTFETWKSIVSCDYCNLHWHLDCLDPPMPSMPSFGKKWMCPNHADHVIQPKRRIPKQNALPIEVTKPKQFNNGNIEIVQNEPPSVVQKVPVDEVTINGRKYRVPERVVVLDFWNKVSSRSNHQRRDLDVSSAMSSPLTSLSELSMDDSQSTIPHTAQHDDEDLQMAYLLCKLKVDTAQETRVPETRLSNESQAVKNDIQSNDGEVRSRAKGTPRKKTLGKSSEPKKADRKGTRQNGTGRPHSTMKAEQDDMDFVPSAGSSRPRQDSATSEAQSSLAQNSSRPRRSSRVVSPRKRSPLPTRAASKDALVALPDSKPAAPPNRVTPVPATIPSSSTLQNNHPPTPSLKIRLPRLSTFGIASSSAAPSTPTPAPTQHTAVDTSVRPGAHKTNPESRSRRSSRRQAPPAAPTIGTPSSASKLNKINIPV